MAEEITHRQLSTILDSMTDGVRSGVGGDDYRAMAAEYAFKTRGLVAEGRAFVARMADDHRQLEAGTRELKAEALVEDATTGDPGQLARATRLEASLRAWESTILRQAADVLELDSALVKLENALAVGGAE
ncbi:hypothetical protein [Paludisphaera sp.]|uniref:hypothetical protein n=1 Tax=Paludisphaera sp. TaxID=2017432 RepID=UPI00301E6123